jgi:hypothetical protein
MDIDELPVVVYTDDYEPEANFAVWTGLIVNQQALKVKYTDIENFEFIDSSQALKLTSFFDYK